MSLTARALWIAVAAAACRGQPRASRDTADSAPAASAQPAGAYDCHNDSALGRPVSIAPTDTAGLGAQIAAHFPGWRLTTEQEIACRFQLTDGSAPGWYWPSWGSGTLWWIWQGDFDGDGRPDRLTILTREAFPLNDKLVVLHGNGTAAEVGPLSGWGVDILNPDEAREHGVPAGVTSAIEVVYWEKGGNVYYWNGSAYVMAGQ